MPYRLTYGLSLLFAVHACVRARPAVDDPALAARPLGRLQVVVRPAERPTQPLPEALVRVRMGQLDVVSRMTDEHGLASFDSLAVGDYEVVVLRIGYGQAQAIVPIKAGCRTDAEAFIALSVVGIDPPPPKRGRVNVTTC